MIVRNKICYLEIVIFISEKLESNIEMFLFKPEETLKIRK